MEDGEANMNITVCLTSGRCASLSISNGCTVNDVTTAAQNALQVPYLTLATADGRILDPQLPLDLQDGETLTAIAEMPILSASESAFLSFTSHGAVTWGRPESGGGLFQERLAVAQVGTGWKIFLEKCARFCVETRTVFLNVTGWFMSLLLWSWNIENPHKMW